MANGIDALHGSTEFRAAQQVEYSLKLLSEITAHYDGRVDEADYIAARCMIDAFYVHVRLMADFLVKPTHSNDLGPADFGVVDWEVPEAPESARLRQYWVVASKHVVHFGRRRVPADLADLSTFQVGGSAWRRILHDVTVVFAEFQKKLELLADEWQRGVDLPSVELEPEAWALRLRWEQAAILRGALAEAQKASQP